MTSTEVTVVGSGRMSRSRFVILLVFIALFCPLIALCYHHLMNAAIFETSITPMQEDQCTSTLENANDSSATNRTSVADRRRGSLNLTTNHDNILKDLGRTLVQAIFPSVQELIAPSVRFLIGLTYAQIWSAASRSPTRFSLNTSSSLSTVNDGRRRLTALASINMWRNLTLMEEVDKLFVESSIGEVTSILLLSNASTNVEQLLDALANRTEYILDRIEALMTSNVALAPLYRKEKSEVEKASATTPSFAMLSNDTVDRPSETATASDFKSHYDPIARDFLVRRQLLNHLTAFDPRINSFDEFEWHALSVAVVRLAKGAEGERVQKIFDEAVQTTMDKIDLTPGTSYSDQIDKILFPTLTEKLGRESFSRERVAVRTELFEKSYGIRIV